MITLDKKDVKYYTIEDGQGATFASDCIFESIKEVKEKFEDWNQDGTVEDIDSLSIRDCLEIWTFTLRKWNGYTFEELPEDAEEFNFIKNN